MYDGYKVRKYKIEMRENELLMKKEKNIARVCSELHQKTSLFRGLIQFNSTLFLEGHVFDHERILILHSLISTPTDLG